MIIEWGRPPRGRASGLGKLAILTMSGVVALSACSLGPAPTPYPTPVPTPSLAEASVTAQQYLAAWRAGNFERMWGLLSPVDQVRYGHDRFVGLHRQFATLARVTGLETISGDPQPAALPPEPRLPAPQATASANASASGAASPSAAATASGAASPAGTPSASGTASGAPSSADSPVAAGPVPGIAVPVSLVFATDLLGEVRLQRTLTLGQGGAGWQVHWSPEMLFPELGSDGTLSLTRQSSPRGRIASRNGTVFAMTRKDGMRVYPQESLAGQTIGYVTKVTAEDLKSLAAKGYRAGDWVGRSGLERGAEALLRGTPGFTLTAKRPGEDPVTVSKTTMTPGATLTISLQPDLQRAAEAAMSRYPRVGNATVDPRSGEVWVLASLPAFDPNAMTLGTTLRGIPLARASQEQITNKAVLGAYPAGSSFKPFTLGAALQTRTVTPATQMLCPGTWTYSGFTFKNWMMESLGGLRPWVDTMALSCNTTYMPLSVMVYERNKTALTDLQASFGFGKPTGIEFVSESPGVLPDAAYFKTHTRWTGKYSPYGPFDQIQLAIGQGSFLGTPLQLAMAYAAWGNRGTLWRPRLVLKATLPDGQVVYQSKPSVHGKIPLSRSAMDFVVTTLRAVVTSPLGTATRAFAGFPIAAAGKSGTAETGGPDPDAWFPAFAPMNGPTIAVATVVVTVPLGTGGDFAAPITRRVMEAYFFR
jgi:cell division protein FtsI/penicillin-binding protein 2